MSTLTDLYDTLRRAREAHAADAEMHRALRHAETVIERRLSLPATLTSVQRRNRLRLGLTSEEERWRHE